MPPTAPSLCTSPGRSGRSIPAKRIKYTVVTEILLGSCTDGTCGVALRQARVKNCQGVAFWPRQGNSSLFVLFISSDMHYKGPSGSPNCLVRIRAISCFSGNGMGGTDWGRETQYFDGGHAHNRSAQRTHESNQGSRHRSRDDGAPARAWYGLSLSSSPSGSSGKSRSCLSVATKGDFRSRMFLAPASRPILQIGASTKIPAGFLGLQA